MNSQYTPGFDSFGFLIPNEIDAISQLVASAWDAGVAYPSLEGETRLLQSYYSSLWMHSSNGYVSSIMETGSKPGMIATIHSLPKRKHMMVLIGDINDHGPSPQFYPFYIQCAQPWLTKIEPSDEPLPLSLTITASYARFFEDADALAADPKYSKYPPAYICPTFPKDGGPPIEPLIFATGKVLIAVKATNNFTNDSHWSLLIRTLGGDIWVNLPESAFTEDPTSQIIAVQGIGSGSFPSLTPAPLCDTVPADPHIPTAIAC